VIAEMFLSKFFSLIPFLQNLCSEANLALLSFVMYPVCAPISNGATVVLWWLISVSKWLYFCSFNLLAVSILCSAGHVSSKMFAVFFLLSTTTMSGFRGDTTKFGGRVPPPGVWCHKHITFNRITKRPCIKGLDLVFGLLFPLFILGISSSVLTIYVSRQ
jgi:hypothetical protein